jgi:hypothetical protein
MHRWTGSAPIVKTFRIRTDPLEHRVGEATKKGYIPSVFRVVHVGIVPLSLLYRVEILRGIKEYQMTARTPMVRAKSITVIRPFAETGCHRVMTEYALYVVVDTLAPILINQSANPK